MRRTVNFQFPNGFYGRASIGRKPQWIWTLKDVNLPWKVRFHLEEKHEKLTFIEKLKIAALSVLHFSGDFRAVTEIAALRQCLVKGHSEKQNSVVKSSDKEVHLENNAES